METSERKLALWKLLGGKIVEGVGHGTSTDRSEEARFSGQIKVEKWNSCSWPPQHSYYKALMLVVVVVMVIGW